MSEKSARRQLEDLQKAVNDFLDKNKDKLSEHRAGVARHDLNRAFTWLSSALREKSE